MFETLTMAKLYLKQGLYKNALEIINKIMTDENDKELWFYKACALEGLDDNEKAEEIVLKLIEHGYNTKDVFVLLEKIYTKIGKTQPKEENICDAEIAKAYEMIGDLDNAVKYYMKKVNKLELKKEENDE